MPGHPVSTINTALSFAVVMAFERAHRVVKVLEPDELPVLVGADAQPVEGWTVLALSKVYKDGVAAGVFVELTILRDGSSVLTYEEIRRFAT